MVAASVDLLDEIPSAHRASRPAEPYGRRRLMAGFALAGVLTGGALVAGRVAAVLGGAPASVPERRPVPITYVVQPGDTMWSIAERYGSADLWSTVQAMARANGGSQVVVGQRLVVPG
jgi:hypothetical protein